MAPPSAHVSPHLHSSAASSPPYKSQVWQFCGLHWSDTLLYSYIFAAAACIIVIAVPLETHELPLPSNDTAGRRLRGGGGVVDSGGDAAELVEITLGSLGAQQVNSPPTSPAPLASSHPPNPHPLYLAAPRLRG